MRKVGYWKLSESVLHQISDFRKWMGTRPFFFQHHSYCNREIKKKKKPFNISGRVARCRFKHRVGGENEGRIDLVEASRKTKRLKWI